MPLNLNQIIRAAKNSELIITPKLQEWLIRHGDEEVPPDIAQKVYEQLITPPRVRSASFSASSAGMCERRQVLAYLGVPEFGAIDPRLQNIFNDGKWRHLRWQTMLLMAGLLGDMEDPQVWKRMRSRGTMDGRGIVPDDHARSKLRGLEFGFELKGANPYVYTRAKKSEEIKEEHRKQVHRYFLMSGLDLFVVIYEDKATQDWFEWVFEADDELLREQMEELTELNSYVDRQRLPAMLPQCKARIGPVWKECPYGGSLDAPCPKAGGWPRIRKETK